VIAETEDRVDRAIGLHAAEGQVGPLGELLGDKPPDEGDIDLKLIRVHPVHQPEP
jgi:hypothetical protein